MIDRDMQKKNNMIRKTVSNSGKNWEKELLEIRSASESIYLAHCLEKTPEDIPLLLKTMEHPMATIAWRAGWVLDHFERLNNNALSATLTSNSLKFC
jgi:hypothetical protein